MMKLTTNIILIISIIGLFSCTNKTSITSGKLITKDNEVTKQINFVGQWMGEGNRELLIRDYVRQYEFLNQDVSVNLMFPEDIGFNRYSTIETHQFIGNVLNSDNPEWDVLLLNDDVEGLSNYMKNKNWASDNLVDFSQYPELTNNTIPEIDLVKIKKRWGGIIPGPFLEGQYWALWTNKNVTQKLGIEVKQYGMTFDDFLGYVKAVDNYNKNNTDQIKPFLEASDWTTIFSLAIGLYISNFDDLDELMDDNVSEKKLQFWHKTLKSLEEIAAYNFVDDDWKGLAWNDIKLGLLNEECLFFSNGSWMYNIWLQEDPSKVMNCVPNEFPTYKQTILYPTTYPIMWGVLKKSPNKEHAIKFLLDMTKPTMAENWVRNTKCPTGIKGSLADANFATDQYEAFSTHLQKTYGSNTYKMSENSSFIFGSEFSNENNYFLEVISGDISADQAMELIQSNLNNLLTLETTTSADIN